MPMSTQGEKIDRNGGPRPQTITDYQVWPLIHTHLSFPTAKGSSPTQNGEAELPLHYSPDGRLAKPTNLSLVVKDAVRRWYLETEKEAERGDIVRFLFVFC